MAQDQRLTIEPASPEDVDTIVDRWVDLAIDQREHGSHVVPEPNRDVMRDVLLAHQFDDGLLVARLDGEPVGFVSFSVERGSLTLEVTRGLISNLYVDPPCRNRGIGEALLEAAETALANRGVEVVLLEAMADNRAVKRFYRRQGYDVHRVAFERRLDEKR